MFGLFCPALEALRGTTDVSRDLDEMRTESKSADQEKVSIITLFRKRSLRMPLLISIVMQLSQQFSGINAVNI